MVQGAEIAHTTCAKTRLAVELTACTIERRRVRACSPFGVADLVGARITISALDVGAQLRIYANPRFANARKHSKGARGAVVRVRRGALPIEGIAPILGARVTIVALEVHAEVTNGVLARPRLAFDRASGSTLCWEIRATTVAGVAGIGGAGIAVVAIDCAVVANRFQQLLWRSHDVRTSGDEGNVECERTSYVWGP
jgi:hypothetical protein